MNSLEQKHNNSEKVMQCLRDYHTYKKNPTARDIAFAANMEIKDVYYVLNAMAALGHVVVMKPTERGATRYRMFIPRK